MAYGVPQILLFFHQAPTVASLSNLTEVEVGEL